MVPGAALAAVLIVSPGAPARRRTPPEGEIVFASLTKPALGEAGYDVFTMNLDGTNRRRITDDDTQEFLPHFSPPDGRRLVFTRYVTGGYSVPGSDIHVVVYDFATRRETDLGRGVQPVWSPDGSRLAFMSARFSPWGLCVMNADGSFAREIARPSGFGKDATWGDPAWSADGWILVTVGEEPEGPCFKVRLDRLRPDGGGRTIVTDGGPSCTPPGKEQCGDADPGFSPDGKTIFTSRGLPYPPAGGPLARTERHLVALSAAAWLPGKPEIDLSLRAFPSAVEGVPKVSPDGRRVLLFRTCYVQAASGIALSDTAGTFRRFLGEGFGADWHPLADSRADRDDRASWRNVPISSAALSPLVPAGALLGPGALEEADGRVLTLGSEPVNGAPLAAFGAEWRLPEPRASLVALSFRLRARVAGSDGTSLGVMLYDFETGEYEPVLADATGAAGPHAREIELGDLRYVRPEDGAIRARVVANGAPGGPPITFLVDELRLDVLAVRR